MQAPADPPSPPNDDLKPLASYVLRVRGTPATLRYELLDLRSGEHRVFRRSDSLRDFLQRSGLERDAAPANDGAGL